MLKGTVPASLIGEEGMEVRIRKATQVEQEKLPGKPRHVVDCCPGCLAVVPVSHGAWGTHSIARHSSDTSMMCVHAGKALMLLHGIELD